jgi:PAS domain S-box-containing protein
MNRGKQLVMDAIDQRLSAAAATLEFLLADDFHDRALDESSISLEEELCNRERINAFVKRSGFTSVYTLVKRGGVFYFTANTVTVKELREHERWYFSPYADAPASFHRALEMGQAVYANYSDRRGAYRSVALPRRSPGGKGYLACVDLPMSDMRVIERTQLLRSLLASLSLLLALLPIMLLYRWEITAHNRSLTYVNQRLKDAAQASEERFRRLFEHSADAVAVLNAWELVEYVNPAFSSLFGWPREELVGRVLPIVPSDEAVKAAMLVEALRDRAEAYRDLETRRITKNGTVLDVSISGAPLSDGRGGFAGSLLIIRDRTQRRRLEERFAQGEKLRAVSSLAAGAAHDFNNALMIIQGNVSLLELECELSERGREIMKGIQNALHSAAALTRELLDFAHPNQTELEPTDVAAVAVKAIDTYLGSRPGLHAETDFADGPLIALAKGEGLERVLVNLLVNADHAMSGSGTVCVSARPSVIDAAAAAELSVLEGRYIVLRVADSGCGMTDDVRHHLFEPLFTTKKHGVGTGLGLATAYATIRSFGGAIEAESKVGLGSTFSLYLPVAPSS